jgi:hypothetical protein
MPVHPLLERSGFDPEHIVAMSIALENVCAAMGIRSHEHSRRELVAR